MAAEQASPFAIGILGCANIAKKNCRAAGAAACRVVAVASRRDDKARGFVREVLGDDDPAIFAGGEDAYARLLEEDRTAEAVYVPLPTRLHERYVRRALASGRHVLLEKPTGRSGADYADMVKAAIESGKLLMDG